ncbi:hypothetical protein EYF80_004329 [Liparis tanakae]|uniref:Uncharacterized protein n=1 Tax=Liparis tanakae TaxID=230148 RepID=A0A4Z2J5L7_9TELE|nr:hypothetical protein EYF80_004329 [Liparis tanakae]
MTDQNCASQYLHDLGPPQAEQQVSRGVPFERRHTVLQRDARESREVNKRKVDAGELGADHMQVHLLHVHLQPAERAVQPRHQQTLGRSVLTGRRLVQNRQAEGLSPAEGCDPRRLSLHVTMRS